MLDLAGKPQIPVDQGKQLPSVSGPSYLHEIMGSILVGIVLVASVLMFFLDRAAMQQLSRLDDQYDQRQQELLTAPLVDIHTRVLQYTQAAAILRARVADGPAWSNFLKEIQKTFSPGITLNTLSVDDKGLVKLDGSATSYQEVATYLATLRGSSQFQEIELIVTSLHETAGGRQVQFSLAFVVPSVAKLAGVTVAGGFE
ncbi:PilN domain-containing protein [Candidatus Berkelbacteria bacterium]|nr:PilN domain-containing protein [Candidatus Berkelbacteria bacterium]